MRKLLVLFFLLAFVASGTWVFGRNPDQERQAEPHIKCCFQDGQCLETKRDNCMLKKGIIVQDCNDCPGVWGKGTKEK